MPPALTIPELVSRVNASLPEDNRAEECVLSTVLAEMEYGGKHLKEKAFLVNADVFYQPLHRLIFETAQRVWNATGDVEWQAVTKLMPDAHNAIAYLSVSHVTPDLLAYNVERLNSCLAKRQIVHAALTTAVAALDLNPDAPDTAAIIGSGVEALAAIQAGSQQGAVTLREAYLAMLDQLGQPKSLGTPTPFPRLNEVTPGFKDGKYWLISGGPSDGKSAMVQNLTSGLINRSVAGVYYSAELTTEDLTQRYMAINQGLSLNVWEKVHEEITHEEQHKLADATRWPGLDLLHIVDAVGWTPDQVTSHMAEMAAKGCKWAVVDYLTLLELDYLAPKMREQQVARASQKFQRAAKKTGMLAFILSQLNDDGQVRESRAPHQDCDVHARMEKVLATNEAGEEYEVIDQRKMRIMKSRQGKRGSVFRFHFQGEFQKFNEMDFREEDNAPQQPKKSKWRQHQ